MQNFKRKQILCVLVSVISLFGAMFGIYENSVSYGVIAAEDDTEISETEPSADTTEDTTEDITEEPTDIPDTTEPETEPPPPPENHHLWKQTDPRWAWQQMGGVYNYMSGLGCLVTDIAIACVDAGAASAYDFNPGTLAKAINDIGGFNQWGGLSRWSDIAALVPGMQVIGDFYFHCSSEEDKTAEIKSWIDQGFYVIPHCKYYLDQNGLWQSHWVYAEDVVDGRVIMNDPASDYSDMFGSYWYKFATDYMVMRGPNSPSTYTAPLYMGDGEIDIDILYYPNKVVFNTGDPLNLNGGIAIVSGIDPNTGTYYLKQAEYIGYAKSYETLVHEYDNTKPGTCIMYLRASAYGKEVIKELPITVVGEPLPVVTSPPETTLAEQTETTVSVSNSTDIQTTQTTAVTALPNYTTNSETTSDKTSSTVTTTKIETPVEFYNSGTETVKLYSEPFGTDEPVAEIPSGYVVKVVGIYAGYGKIELGDSYAWTDIELLSILPDSEERIQGDINNDGIVDICDLSLLNEYLRIYKSENSYITFLSQKEVELADMNCDGITDEKDILAYLSVICR